VAPLTLRDKSHDPVIWSGPVRLGVIDGVTSEYRLSQALATRLLGFYVAGLGVLVFLLTALVGLLALPVAVLGVGVAVVVVAVVAGGFMLTRRATVVTLDDAGYRVRLVRGTGVSSARWVDVEDVLATEVAGERCVVLRLRDGRTTTVPVRVLAGSSDAFVRDLQEHLDRGHGYRRLR
jgi:hypothetical protein